MMRGHRAGLTAAVLVAFLGAGFHSGTAAGQSTSPQDQVVGTWAYVSVDLVKPDGSRVPLFGPHPHGLAVFDSGGHYLLMTARDAMSRFASTNRMEGTADENKAVVQGSIAHFGTYTINESARTISFHIDTSTFPNWNGTDQTRPFAVTGDQLKWVTPASTGTGSAEVVLKRAN